MPKKTRVENLFELDRRDDNRFAFTMSARTHAMTAEWITALRQTYGGQIPAGTTDAEREHVKAWECAGETGKE